MKYTYARSLILAILPLIQDGSYVVASVNFSGTWSCDISATSATSGICHLHSHLHLIVPAIMPKKSWASVDQQNWLFAQLAEFHQAQDAKTTPSFFAQIFNQFHDQWPVDSPTMTEIADAEGNEEQAETVKEKASESVSGWFGIYLCNLLIYCTCASEFATGSTTRAEVQVQALQPEVF
jgi:hypothetical protein